MRTAHIVLCASALLVTTGVLAAGCISSSGNAPDGGGEDAGELDAFVSNDGGPVIGFDASDASLFDAGSFDASVFNTTIDFGLVGCGSGTATQTFSFTNTSAIPISYTASIPSGSVFSIEGASSGTVAPGANVSLTINVSSIPTTSTAGTPIAGTLEVDLNAAGAFGTHQVPLSVTPQGGSLTVAPALAGFGQVQLANNGTPIPLTISNVGNAAVNVAFGPPTDADGGVDTDFAVTYPGSPAAAAIPAGGSLADAGATFLPTTAGLRAVTAAILTTDPLCASAATGVAMSGTGSTAHVTVGPDPLQFGTVVCGQTGAALKVTIKNSSPDAVDFTAALTLGASSPFKIDVSSGVVPGLESDGGDGQVVITVTPKTIGVPSSVIPGAFNDTLTVTPAAPGVSPTMISLQESAAGAILAVSMPTTAYGTVVNTTDSLPFNVTNTGNRDAPLALTTTGAGYASAFTSTTTATADGGMAGGSTSFTATSNGAVGGSVKVTTTATLCAAAPAAITLTATGAVPVASIPGATIDVNATCGNGATTQGSVLITNTGKAPLTISGAASKNGHFTIVSSPGTIAANGGTGSIVIQASAIALSATTTIADSLTFTTNEVGSPSHAVPVSVTALGANLSVVMANTAFGTVTTNPSSLPFSVNNSGNVAAPLVLTPGGSGYTASFTSSSTAAAAGSAPGGVTFTPPGDGSYNGTLNVTTTAVLCSITPPQIMMSAIGSVSIASFPATTLSVGAICGNGATTQATVVVTNNGTAPMALSGVSSKNGTFTIVSSPPTIAANGGTGTIKIQAATINQGTPGGSTLDDTLMFTTNEVGDPTHSVPVTVAVSGANLSFVGGNLLTMGPGCGSVNYSVQNTGNMQAFVTGTGNYPSPSDSVGDTNVFDFEGGSTFNGAFATSTAVNVGTPVMDTMTYGSICGLAQNPCLLTGTQPFSSLSGAGNSVGICIPLPNLSLEINFSAMCGDCC
jgi:hypothetical protein